MFLVHQPMAGGAAKSCFQSGDRVVVQFADAGWCPGVVSARSARRDGKGSIYKVTFDDGEVWNDVSPSDMEYEEDIHAVKRRKRSCIMQPTGAANSDSNQEAEATVEPAASHGDRVIARDSRCNWCEGKVVDNDEDGNRVKVHFKGWGSRWDEWISFGTGRLRPLPLLADYDVGDFLTARNLQESWCRAKVLGTRNYHLGGPQQLHVHFFGHAAKLDEWIDVDSGRLRPLLIGERVLARDSSGNWISATVTGERDEDSEARQLKVSFDGWAARWDEWILVASGRLQRLKIEEGPPDDSKPNKVKAEPPSPKQDLRRGGSELHELPQDSASEQQSRRRRVPSEPHEAPQGALKVGQRVRARFLASSRGPSIANKWYAGVITAANVDGTYNIRYDDEDEETDVLSKFVQPLLDGASEAPHGASLVKKFRSSEPPARNGLRQASAVNVAGALKVGQRVRARFQASSQCLSAAKKWYPGVITATNVDGTYNIRYDDEDEETDVLSKFVQPLPDGANEEPPARNGTREAAAVKHGRALELGQRVRARFLASSQGPSIAKTWYPGVITATNVDGTYDIRYDDKDEEADVLSEFVQPLPEGASEEPPARNHTREATAVETGQQPASPAAAARQHSAIAAQRLLLLAQSHVATAPYSVGASTVASPQLASGAEIPQGVANGLDALRQHITCPICHRMLVRAQVLPCQHAFCEECIHNVLRATSPNSLCVVCKSPFFRREISASTLLQHIVDTYQAMAAPVSASSQSS